MQTDLIPEDVAGTGPRSAGGLVSASDVDRWSDTTARLTGARACGPPEPRTAEVPARIGRYLVLEEVGAGGMGVVYAAYDPELDRKVAIKLIYSEADQVQARRSHAMLFREAQALAKLSHPNIVAIHDVGEHAGQVFVAMEFVVGCTLRRWRETAPRSWPEIVAAFVQAGHGLMAAHAAGLVHRDIKPDNLLLGDDGRVRVADFGVARHNASDAAEVTMPGEGSVLETVAGPGAMVGTPAYMAPEQHDNAGVGAHSDQFSFCVALYEALHGLRPFAGDSNAALVAAIRIGDPCEPPSPSRLPPWLDRAVRRGLALRPEDRWPSMQQLLAELTQDRDAVRARRRRQGLLAVLMLVGAAALVLGARALQASRAHAEAEATATVRLAVVASGIDRLLARGRRAEAEEALRAFLAEPEHRGSRAAIDAWLQWAARMAAAGDTKAALAALVEAYTELPAGDDRESAIHAGMARLFRADWRFHELATIAAQAGRRAPETRTDPAWAQLRADTALARRDIAGFLAEVDAGRLAGDAEAVAPVLRALAAARFPGVAAQGLLTMPVDLKGDGRQELALVDTASGRYEVRRMDSALTLLHRDWPGRDVDPGYPNRASLSGGPGGPAYVIGHTRLDQGGEATLYEVGPAMRPLVRWADHRPIAAAVADLEGDGTREVYVGAGPYTRTLSRLAPDADGVWQRSAAHPPTDALASDINALASGDFDGDGRDELAVAAGPWRAYDVRILEAGADGARVVGARWRLGNVKSMTTLRAADGATLLALAKDDHSSSKEAFPASQPNGEPAGLYIVRREGASLRPLYFSPLPSRVGDPPGQLLWMAAADFDGDGLDDLVAAHDPFSRDEFSGMLVWRQMPDGDFAGASLGYHVPVAVGNFDEDAADELLVHTRGPDGALAFAILGAGGPALPALEPMRVPGSAPVLVDPELASAWTRAEELASFGLFAAAAAALERRISLAQTPDDRRAVQLRAAELRDASGDHAAAAAGQEMLAQEGDLDAAFAALAGYEDALRLADALRVARELVARLDLDEEQRALAAAASQRLARVVEPGDRLELRFDRPLEPQWHIEEPLALRVDPVRGELLVDVTAEMRELASLPLEVSGGPLGLAVDLEVERAEWSGTLTIGLEDPGGVQRFSVGVTAGGGGGYLHRCSVFNGPEANARADIGTWPVTGPDERSQHRLQVQVLPDQGVLHVEERGDHGGESRYLLTAPLVPGTYRLTLKSTGIDLHGAHQLRARVRRISVTGARLSGQTRSDAPRDRAALALVDGRWRDALAEPANGELEQLWHAVAAAELARLPEAIAILGALDPNGPALRLHLRHLLRARPVLALPLLRAAYGLAYADLLREALVDPSRVLDEELQRVWLAVGGDLEALPATDAAQIETKAVLLRMRALVRQSLGELEYAAADIDAAIDLYVVSAIVPPVAPVIAELELLRAQVAAARGQRILAIRAASLAVERTHEPAWMVERIRMDVRFDALRSDPSFARLLATYP